MEIISLKQVVQNMYNHHASFIREKNNELEREFFGDYRNAPLAEIMQGGSFEDNFNLYKSQIKYASQEEVDNIFVLLREYFLFSYGHDMMFKKKLEADLFTTPLMEFLYPKLEEAIKEKYNDISVMQENPNFDINIKGIDNIIEAYLDMQSILYLLYSNDFQFPGNWEKMCNGNHEKVIEELNNSGMTIGDFLKALIDDKCKTIREILEEIDDRELRNTYLKELENLRNEKIRETEGFAHVHLPITYFLDHTIMDFIRTDEKSKIYVEDKPKVNKKLFLPGDKKDD